MRRSSRSIVVCLLISVLIVGIAKWRVDAFFEWRYPPLNELVVTDQYTTDLGSLFLGAHRLAADIAYVQFLQYYGVHDPEGEDRIQQSGGKEYHIHDMTAGKFSSLKQFGTRITRLDPFFNP